MPAQRATTSRRIGWIATFVALHAGAHAADARAQAGPHLATSEAASQDVDARIEALVQRWFAQLEDPGVEAEALGDPLGAPPFELVLDGATLQDRAALLAWVVNLRATYPEIHHRIDRIRIQAEGPERFRVRFEFDRHAVDEAGASHVARREHTWTVHTGADAALLISRMIERPLLFFPGSGPRIVCY